ncbi:MAG: 1,4-dihydroxy-2-naphthoate octaprenyltransferase [bacterium ADurb.BinA186]|nr:MAG: 1,4-dihydroxy-2-naphthoate octaprenyltransferase [bacterium ADurb.BinA186]
MNSSVKTNSCEAWFRAIRPRTLGAISCPILLGSSLALAKENFSWQWFFMTWLCSLLLQILANVVNDYGDFVRGSDTKERLGPPRALQMGWLSIGVMKTGIALIIASIACLGLILVARGGLAIFWLGLVSIGVSIWYTAGPKPLAYLGFSEIAVLILFGPAPVLGAYFIQTLSWPDEGLILSLAPAFLSTALIMTNNLRDIKEDSLHHKNTIAVRCGERFSRLGIISLVILSSLSPFLMMIFYDFKWPVLLSLVALFFPVRMFPMVLQKPISAQFNLMLAAIGKSLYIFGVLMSFGIIYGAP